MTCNHPWRALLFVSVLLLSGALTLADQKADDEALIGKRLEQFETYVYEGNYGRAAVVVQLLWKDHYKNPDVKVADARARIIRGDVQTAQSQLEVVLKEHPDHPLATATLAIIQVRANQSSDARVAIDKALARIPMPGRCCKRLAICTRRTKNWSRPLGLIPGSSTIPAVHPTPWLRPM